MAAPDQALPPPVQGGEEPADLLVGCPLISG
jgi:hypothetical protein